MGKGDAARYEQQQKESEREGERKQRALEHIKNAKALQVYNGSNITYTLCKKIPLSFMLSTICNYFR